MGKDPVTREEVPAEEQAGFLAPVTGVSRGLSGEVDRPEPAPKGKLVAVGDPSVRNEGFEGEDFAPGRLEPRDQPLPPAVVRSSEKVIEVRLWRGDPRSVSSGEPGGVEDVVEMAVGQEDAPDRKILPSPRTQGPAEGLRGAGEAAVDQVEGLTIPQHIKRNAAGGNLEEVVMEIFGF